MLGTWAGTAAPNRLGEAVALLTGLLACQLFFYLNGVDKLILAESLGAFLRKMVTTLVLMLLVAGTVFHWWPQFSAWPSFLTAMVMSAALLLAMRPVLQFLLRRKRVVECHLILGTGTEATSLYSEMARLYPAPAGMPANMIQPGSTVNCGELNDLALRHRFSTVIVAEPDAHKRALVARALLDSKLRGLPVHEATESYEQSLSKIWLEGLRPDLVVYTDKFSPSRLYLVFKRAMDLFFATVCAILAAPLLILAAIAVKLDSPGPVFFRQERLGLNGQEFKVCKFRTMRNDAEEETGPVWASASDARVTRVGAILRRYRIDEIPQIFNVIRGEMSFIGPRPERPHFVEMLREHIDYYDLRHYVKPGITGWAQVMYRYGASVEDAYEKLQYDLYYIKHMSMLVDLKVLLKTVMVVLRGGGR